MKNLSLAVMLLALALAGLGAAWFTRPTALELAQRAPLFDLGGTDPEALGRAAERLEEVEQALAAVQASATEAELVRSLYPIAFLRSLAELEGTRRAFLTSGSPADGEKYEKALARALEAGRTDIARFAEAFSALSPARAITIPGPGGMMTSESMRAVITDIEEGFARIKRELDARRRCVAGVFFLCPGTPASLARLSSAAGAEEQALPEILSIVSEAMEPSFRSDPIVRLETSVCLAAHEGPYDVLVSSREEHNPFPLRSLSELFFVRLGEGPSQQYFFDLGMRVYAPNPYAMYLCPEVARDRAAVVASLMLAHFAGEHPSVAPELRERLIRAVSEIDARAYAELLARESDDSLRQAGEEFLRMFRNNSAGLDIVVNEVARTDRVALRLYEEGVPYDVSARYYFLTHSAFPSLFGAHNPSFGSKGVSLREDSETNRAALRGTYIPYEEITKQFSREKLIEDMRTLYRLEREAY